MSEKKDPSKSPRDTNGPVVKTGPTAGQNRSRNDDGAWRKKRSDAGETKKKSGCFLSTATCHFKGLPDDCRELEILRDFRDAHLLSSPEGAALVAHYYSVAPAITEQLTSPVDLEQVWHVICQCVEAIQSGNYEQATEKYRAMVQSLQQKHLGAMA